LRPERSGDFWCRNEGKAIVVAAVFKKKKSKTAGALKTLG
jgi:hypothetical protein